MKIAFVSIAAAMYDKWSHEHLGFRDLEEQDPENLNGALFSTNNVAVVTGSISATPVSNIIS